MRQARHKIASESSSKQTRHYSETGVYIMQNTIGVGEWSLERKTEWKQVKRLFYIVQ